MRKAIALFCLLLVLCQLLPVPAAQPAGQRLSGGGEYAIGGAVLAFDGRFELTGYQTANGALNLQGILLDAGVDGNFLLNTIGHQRFWDMNTWDLANIVPRAGQPAPQELLEAILYEDRVEVTTLVEGMELRRVYTPTPQGLRVDARLTSRRNYVSEIQGISLQLNGAKAEEDTAFRFPGNLPYEVTRLGDLRHFATRQAAYCAPLVRVDGTGEDSFNLAFLHTKEKWSTALWRDRDMNLQAAFLVMAEGLLSRDEAMDIGPMYLQLTKGLADPYAPARELYAQRGWRPPQDGFRPAGPMYSAHPHGTMDSGFRERRTMAEFAAALPELKDMGIKSVWILPIFEHTGRGVYEPTDQAIIDPRYGTDDDVRLFSDTAADLGIKLLFDYVPHGPYPEDPLAINNPQWCSVHRSGRLQIEWDCVSFDMANPEYQAYTKDLVTSHIRRFDVDGGRIDCAMGGLSNWNPVSGNRPSQSGLDGGVQIVGAIREAFVKAGKQPLLLPENFHPLPFYAPVTDVFYDMPLYRVMFELRQKGVDEAAFARTLARWLEDEYLSGVPGLTRLRFLGNHDTVSWTWDRQRATEIYGADKARALWTLLSFIDGIPFLYQGDELSAIYDKRTALDLRGFFKDLFLARADYLRPDMATKYHHNDSALVAFTRQDALGACLALVNLGEEPVTYPLPAGTGNILYGEGSVTDGTAYLGSYQFLLLDLP